MNNNNNNNADWFKFETHTKSRKEHRREQHEKKKLGKLLK